MQWSALKLSLQLVISEGSGSLFGFVTGFDPDFG